MFCIQMQKLKELIGFRNVLTYNENILCKWKSMKISTIWSTEPTYHRRINKHTDPIPFVYL